MRLPWPLGGGVVLACALLATLACGPERLEAPPAELIGVWRTDAPRYRNSYLEVGPASFALGVARLTLESHPIERITRSPGRAGQPVYTLLYQSDEGYEDTLVLTVVSLGEESAIQVGHTGALWKRVGGP